MSYGRGRALIGSHDLYQDQDGAEDEKGRGNFDMLPLISPPNYGDGRTDLHENQQRGWRAAAFHPAGEAKSQHVREYKEILVHSGKKEWQPCRTQRCHREKTGRRMMGSEAQICDSPERGEDIAEREASYRRRRRKMAEDRPPASTVADEQPPLGLPCCLPEIDVYKIPPVQPATRPEASPRRRRKPA